MDNFLKGYNARKGGWAFEDNPFTDDTAAFIDWAAGWRFHETEEKEIGIRPRKQKVR